MTKSSLKYSLAVVALVTVFSCSNTKLESNFIERQISENWTYREIEGNLSGKATVPGTIHTDLLAEGKIEDPFYRVNEKNLQWIDKKDWEYSTVFNISEEEVVKSNMELCFEGLDTYADVYLNDSLILSANNMFRSWIIDVKSLVKPGDNTVRIYFHSPINEGLKLLEASPYPLPASNDQSERGGLGDKKVSVFTRKAGYHYGWDWGPRLVTSGIWRLVVLKAWDDLRIQNVFIRQPKVTSEQADLVAEITIQSDRESSPELTFSDSETGEHIFTQQLQLKPGVNTISVPFQMKNPKLWWSAGLGEPHLYTFNATISDGKRILAEKSEVTGLRSLKLVRRKDDAGESFYFELNGIPVFAKGANYIPNDSFLPRVTKADYEKVIADAVDANMNMLRIWGGGTYENDFFYELCDKNGLLVWQDFMFACSMYPGNADFLENIKQEAIDNVVRLRNHPCIALWCGNNEINWGWSYYTSDGWGWKDKYTSEQRDEVQKTYLSLFHGILPDVLNEYTDGDSYWPSSPLAGYEPDKIASYENTSGDMHYWDVWHGFKPLEDYDKTKARYMSEYGFQSFSDFETVKKYAIPEDFDIESEVMASHQRSDRGNQRIKTYLGWDYKIPSDFEQFLYMSQVLQAKAIKMAIESHRRAMPYCMGSMYWQINDCWPVASWSSTDYYHKWKALHYAVRKAFKPVLLSAIENEGNIEIYGVSDYLQDQGGQLELTVLDFCGNEIDKQVISSALNKNTSILLYSTPAVNLLNGKSKNVLLLKMVFKSDSKIVADNIFYFSKPKDLELPKAQIKTEFIEDKGNQYLKVSSDNLVKDLYLSFGEKEVIFSDNYFDLLPGESRMIKIDYEGIAPELGSLKTMSLDLIQ